jgi:hypothetical protein
MKRNIPRIITLFLSICVSVFAACFWVLQIADEYYTARNNLDMYNKEYEGWEACRQTEPTYYEANKDAVNNCVKNLEEAKNNFWAKRSKNEVTALFVLAGLGSAVAGYLVVWSVWFVCSGIYRFIQMIKRFFRNKIFRIGHQDDEEYDMNTKVEELEYHLSTAVDEKESTREDLKRQIEMLRNEICSIHSEIEKLSTIEDTKRSASRDKHINELFLKGIKQKGINFY